MITKYSILRNVLVLVAVASFGSPGSAAVVRDFEFDSGVEGFIGNNITGLAASGGFLTGTASSNDPQLILGVAQLPGGLAPLAGSSWTTLEYSVRETNSDGGGFVSFANASNPTGLVFSSNLGVINSPGLFSFVDAGSGFTNVTIDISGLGTSTITNFRLDPIGGGTGPVTAGNFFEVGFIRLNDASAIPEPSSIAALIMIGGVVASRRRRRS